MKRILLFALPAFAACGGVPDLTIPPLAVGTSGTRLMTGDARNPGEAYDNAFGSMTKLHLQIHEGLRPPANRIAIRSGLDDIINNLLTMQALVIEEQRDRFNAILKDYREWRALAENGQTNGLGNAMTRGERDIRSTLGPSKVTLIAELPGAGTVARKVPEKVEPARTEPKHVEPAKVEPVTPAKDVSHWMIYAAWRTSHADLVEAVTKKGEWQKQFGRVLECVAAMKSRVSEEGANTLQVYANQYKMIQKKLADGGSEAKDEFILKDLGVVSSLIENGFNPDKK